MREDTKELWHLRAGHLGPEALKALVSNTRNVKIKGTVRIECESYARAHAGKVISRQPAENKSACPFWRIAWDLFDYPESIDGSRWMLVIIDEYSGKLFPFLLTTKSLDQIMGVIQNFESWVRHQYGLAICKIKQDNNTATISPAGQAPMCYQNWAEENGIDVELSPLYTHEPNGLAERAGQELMVCSIKMLSNMNLPEKLWSKSVQAAMYLHSISPSKAHEFRSPNEVLYSWFKQYFHWVIMTRNVHFNEKTFYHPGEELPKEQSMRVSSLELNPYDLEEELDDSDFLWQALQ
ncbi:hypothetical protein VTH82DRAFT_664 [Thermothelomyces myriococcoides]